MLESREIFGDGPEMGQHTGKDTSLIRARYTVRLVAEIVDHDSSIRAPGTSFHPHVALWTPPTLSPPPKDCLEWCQVDHTE
jgi:hypothetical protein